MEGYTHYPVPSEVKVSEEQERTSGVDMILYSHAAGPRTEARDPWIKILDQVRYKKVSHLRNEMVTSR